MLVKNYLKVLQCFFLFLSLPTAYRKRVCHDIQAECFPDRNSVDSRTKIVQFIGIFSDVFYQTLQNIENYAFHKAGFCNCCCFFFCFFVFNSWRIQAWLSETDTKISGSQLIGLVSNAALKAFLLFKMGKGVFWNTPFLMVCITVENLNK